jgi:hypothetical protein
VPLQCINSTDAHVVPTGRRHHHSGFQAVA